MSGPTIEVRQGDVTRSGLDVIVNASNTGVWLGSGVSGAIRAAAGPGYQEQIQAAMRARFGDAMEPGEVLITGAGAIPGAKHVAHVAVMDYREGHQGEAAPDEARICRASVALWRAIEALTQEPLSVGMVALGAGTGNLGVRLPTEIACETLKAHLAKTPDSRIARVVFHGYQVHEFANVLHVVKKHFAVDTSGIAKDVLEYVDSVQ